MAPSFFEGREHIKGIEANGLIAMCTSTPEVREWLRESLSYVFKQVPDRGGVLTLTASESLTNCWSRPTLVGNCPRCAKRTAPDVIAEVNRTIAEGVWEGNPATKVIVWDWGCHLSPWG